MNKELSAFKKKVRESIANYMSSEGCSCCRDYESHQEHEKELGKMLNVKPYSDGSGYDFSKHRSKR